jgi:hypothetical protein
MTIEFEDDREQETGDRVAVISISVNSKLV